MDVHQVGRLLGVTRERVRQLSKEGELEATPDAKGAHRFDAAQVCLLILKRQDAGTGDGATPAILAFDMFAHGADLLEVMRSTGLPAPKVRELYNEWRTPLGAAPPERELELARDRDRRETERTDKEDAEDRRRREESRERTRKLIDDINGKGKK